MKNIFAIVLTGLTANFIQAQVPSCSPDVPYHYVDLTGQPAGAWESPGHSREGNCCGTVSPDRCTSFDVVLDSQAAMISFNIASGAIPTGSMFYQIDCGPQIPVGQPICIVGTGPHHVTFCKPGNNQNTYMLTSIPKPIFPVDATVRYGCSKQLTTLGLEIASVTWTSVYPGSQGQYDSYLSCTSACPAPVYTPAINAPAYIDYKVCGYPIADECGFVAVCDTVRIYNVSALSASVSPNPAQFCAGGGGVQLTASANGGVGPYTYIWKDQGGNTVGSGSTYQAISAGIYTMEARDVLYDPSMCPSILISIPVVVGQPPVVNAGPDQTICASSPDAYLTGSVQNATGGVWSGGSGTFFPDNTTLTVAYTPTAAELSAGSVTFTLTSTGAGGGCAEDYDVLTVSYPPLLSVSLGSTSLSCNNSTATLTPAVSGGIIPYGFSWNNGPTSPSVNVGAGNYCVNITDAMGCTASACANVTAPAALALTMSSTDATSNGGSDGTAMASPSGGTSPYTYSWSPGGQTAQTATGLSYGVYTATVTDANGCSMALSTVVNEPRCLGFQVTTSGTDIGCNGDLTGTALANVAGGTLPYTYSWNTTPVQTTASVANLGAGTYMTTVTEANGCVDVSSIVISQPPKLVNTMNHTNTSVVAGTDGSATANVSGGTSAYTYAWNNGETTSAISGLTAGVYTVTVADNNGCSLIDSVQIYDPNCASIIMNVYVANASCPGGSDGTATAQILFGIPPYQYLWSNGETTSSITGLSAGVYSVTGWGALLCPHFANVTVAEPSPLSLGITPTGISCSDKNDGTIDLTVSGGTFPYSYSWSNGVSVEDQYLLSDGNYSVTVADANGCSANAATSIIRPSVLTAWDGKTDVTCFGGSDGSVDASAGGGVLPYSYLWSNGATTEDISNLSAGQYLLVVTDANGCTPAIPLSMLIDEPEIVRADGLTLNCPVVNSGVSELIVAPAGGNNGPFQVSVDSGATYMSPGTYNAFLPVDSIYYIFIKDGNGCLSLGDTVSIHPEPAVSAVSFAKCFVSGTSATPVTVTPAGGTGGLYQVSFDNGNNFGVAGSYSGNLPIASSYSAVVKDSLGCISAVLPIIIPDTLALSQVSSSYAGGYNISCNGLTDGNINLSVAGGTASYSYFWNNSSTTEDISGIPAGNYSVTVSDANGCTKSLTVLLNESNALVANSVVSSDYSGFSVSCMGSSNGSVDLTLTGGASPYYYAWSNGLTTQDPSSLSAGNYSVAITDANGCTTTSTISLAEPTALSVSATVTHVTCNGFSNGEVGLTVTGGAGAYSYNWSNSSTTANLSGVTAGSYSASITDANGCTLSTTVSITEPVALSAATSETDVLCHGGNTGTASVAAGGGTSPYNFLWSNGQTSSTATGLSAGTYSITVTDSKGCVFNVASTVNEPALLSSVVTIHSHVSCKGGTGGVASVAPAGGKTPYTYLWSTGNTNSWTNGLTAGNHNVLVTDANGCTTQNFFTITEPAELTATTGQAHVSCNGGNNGTASIAGSGGTTPYTYLWSDGQTSSAASNLTAGSYTVTITDAKGCFENYFVTLTQPAALTSASSQTNVSCNGLSNGAANITVSGGIAPYTYLWSNNVTTSNISGLAAGNYSVTITDANGCPANSAVSITEPAALSSTVTNTNVTCNGGNNGTGSAIAAGGTQPYSFLWSDGQTTSVASGLSQGSYTVNVTDGNGCTYASSVIITQPAILSVSTSSTNVSCNGGNNGTATVLATGGIAPYTYLWSDGQTAASALNLQAGSYTATATDANGCVTSAAVIITEPTVLTASTSNTNVSCNGGNNGSATVAPSGGTTGYTYSWSNGQTNATAVNLAAGTYSVIITDANGCTLTTSVAITEPLALSLAMSSTGASCNGGTDGSAAATAGGGTAPYAYLWNNGQTTSAISGLSVGTYSLVVTDANGCSHSSGVAVGEQTPVVLSSGAVKPLCYGDANGSITLSASGGVAPYSYLWSNGATSQNISGLSAGIYIVNVLDGNQCGKSDTIIITQPDSLTAEVSGHVFATGYHIHPYGGTNGSIILAVNGGTPAYQYAWSNGSTTQNLENLPAGAYSVVITDSNGCTYTLGITLTEPYDLAMPTGISPNGDNRNDDFVVRGLDIYPDNGITIFNRWGDEVYTKEGYLHEWNGQNMKGENLPDGTYFVVLKVKIGETTKVLTGYVDVRR